MLLFLIVVLAAVIFEYSNGFHDAANAIATVVSTKVLTPRQAIAMAAFFNLTGALLGGAVATTVGKGLVDTEIVTMWTVLAALLGGLDCPPVRAIPSSAGFVVQRWPPRMATGL